MFSVQKPRRLRKNAAVRALVREQHLQVHNLVYPIFIEENLEKPQEISALPGLFRWPESLITQEIQRVYDLGIRYIMPFGVSHHKDNSGSDTWNSEGLLARMIKTIKKVAPDLVVIPDICFCEYTDHGHCGVVQNGEVDNQKTVENLVKQSLNAARSGADFLAPSAMMDNQVAAIRQALDENGFEYVGILAHAVKFASAFYGPFRVAVNSNLNGNRLAYQADFSNGRQALLEAKLDEEQGADILMVKPGTPYLDVLGALRQKTLLPLAVYQVGGEYASIKFAALAGVLDEKKVVLETMIGFKRAGADIIVTYFADKIAQWLQEK